MNHLSRFNMCYNWGFKNINRKTFLLKVLQYNYKTRDLDPNQRLYLGLFSKMSTVLGTCWILALLLDEKAAVDAELCDWELTCVASLIDANEFEDETPDLVVVVVVSRWTAVDDSIEPLPHTPTGDPGVEGNEAGGEWL